MDFDSIFLYCPSLFSFRPLFLSSFFLSHFLSNFLGTKHGLRFRMPQGLHVYVCMHACLLLVIIDSQMVTLFTCDYKLIIIVTIIIILID